MTKWVSGTDDEFKGVSYDELFNSKVGVFGLSGQAGQ